MKQSVIQIKFDTDKYNALLRYARKKEVSVEAELLDTADRLYRKLVPSDVREFIEERDAVQEEKLKRSNLVVDENGTHRSGKKYSSVKK